MKTRTWIDGSQAGLVLTGPDIERGIALCGWMILNDAEDMTDDDRQEVRRIEAQGYAETDTLPAMESETWWNRVTGKENVTA